MGWQRPLVALALVVVLLVDTGAVGVLIGTVSIDGRASRAEYASNTPMVPSQDPVHVYQRGHPYEEAEEEPAEPSAALAQFEEYWSEHLASFLDQRSNHGGVRGVDLETVRDTMKDALQKGYINMADLQFLHRSSLLETQEENMVAAGKLGAAEDEPECPRYDGKVCNGEKRGKCAGQKCTCLAGWSGLACQTDPKLRDYDPMTGTSEPNEDCKQKLHAYQKQC